jgi:cytochrome o ubiquinol oxidase subunit 2
MSKKRKAIGALFISVGVVLLGVVLLHGNNFALLNPKGTIASQQRDLMVIATLIMLVVVLPVFVMMAVIVHRYREGNTGAKYTPDWDHNLRLEVLWWGFPLLIIVILGGIIWKSSHDLDPFKPIQANAKTLKIQVIALQWKWLFIYPGQDIATVNYVQFPEDTPVDFEITADAPMNSFWIPQLGGQIYAMSGMSTHLNLMADQTGTYNGSSANMSGEGFAGMKFKATSLTSAEFDSWVKSVHESTAAERLDQAAYDKLAEPTKDVLPSYYSSRQENLYDTVVMKYMSHGGSDNAR